MSAAVAIISHRSVRAVALAAVICVLAMVPMFCGPLVTNYTTRVLIAALFAQSFNVLWSQARLLSFGHAAYFGCGSFAVIHLMVSLEHARLVMPTPLVPVAGLAAGAVVGLAAGYFATARTGTYFAMITLAIGELFYTIAPKWQSLFGGEAGISSMRMPWRGFDFADQNQVYYVVLVWVVAGIGLLAYLARTVFGRLTIAIGDDEGRLAFLGLSTRTLKTLLFAISAGIAGLAGGLLTLTTESVGYDVFSGAVSAAPIMHTFIGGASAFLGPSLGAAVMVVFGQTLSDISRNWLLYQGAGFILVILILPGGLAGGLLTLWRREFPTRGPRLRAMTQIVAGSLLFGFGLIAFAEGLQRHGAGGVLGQAARFTIVGFVVDPATSNLWIVGAIVALAGFGVMIGGKQQLSDVAGKESTA